MIVAVYYIFFFLCRFELYGLVNYIISRVFISWLWIPLKNIESLTYWFVGYLGWKEHFCYDHEIETQIWAYFCLYKYLRRVGVLMSIFESVIFHPFTINKIFFKKKRIMQYLELHCSPRYYHFFMVNNTSSS